MLISSECNNVLKNLFSICSLPSIYRSPNGAQLRVLRYRRFIPNQVLSKCSSWFISFQSTCPETFFCVFLFFFNFLSSVTHFNYLFFFCTFRYVWIDNKTAKYKITRQRSRFTIPVNQSSLFICFENTFAIVHVKRELEVLAFIHLNM